MQPRTVFFVVVIESWLVAHWGVAGQGQDAAEPATRFQQLVEEYEAGGDARELAVKFFELAEQSPQDPVAVDALDWVLKRLRSRPEGAMALERLATRHLASERLAAAFPQVVRTPSRSAEKLLRDALEKSPHQAVRAQACLHLAQLLDQQATIVQQLQRQPESAPQVLEYYGQEYGPYLASLEPKQLDAMREEVYERMLRSFTDVKLREETLGALAEKKLFQIRHLSIGRVAPEIDGEDVSGKRFKLSQYQGKVVMLSFWGHW
jgi:hypothetical protein